MTVVIPAYNLESYIESAVCSAVLQDYPGKLFVIVLDDGSADGTFQVLQRLKARCPNLYIHRQANRGRAEARNRLLALAKTEFIAWLDGDDMASPRWVREQMAAILRDDNIAATGGQGYALTASAKPIGPIEHPLSSLEIEARHLTGQANAFFQSAVTVRRSSVLASGGYRAEYPVAEDFDLWLRLSEVGRLINVNSFHLYYRVHEASANSTLSDHQRLQGTQALDDARKRRGLPALKNPMPQNADPAQHDWGRRVYWINIALKSGNPLSALELLVAAIPRHPASLLLWLFAIVAVIDMVLCAGNRSSGFSPGSVARVRTLPRCSAYRLGRALVRFRRHLRDSFKSHRRNEGGLK